MKKKTICIILTFILVIMLGIGLSYAYFSARILNNEYASTLRLEAGELEIDVDGGNTITASKFIPDSTEPFATKTITLTGKNTTIDLNMIYTMKLVVDNNTFSTDFIKYTLTSTNTSNNGLVIPSQELTPVNSTISIGSGHFTPGSNLIHTYVLKLYFPETGTDQSTNMSAKFSAHIEIVGEEAITSTTTTTTTTTTTAS